MVAEMGRVTRKEQLHRILSSKEWVDGADIQRALYGQANRNNAINMAYAVRQLRSDGYNIEVEHWGRAGGSRYRLKTSERRVIPFERPQTVLLDAVKRAINLAIKTGIIIIHQRCDKCNYPIGWQFISNRLIYNPGCRCIKREVRYVFESGLKEFLAIEQNAENYIQKVLDAGWTE